MIHEFNNNILGKIIIIKITDRFEIEPQYMYNLNFGFY